MAINVLKKGRMYSKIVFIQEQALGKAALATGQGVVPSVCGMPRLALLCFVLGCRTW